MCPLDHHHYRNRSDKLTKSLGEKKSLKQNFMSPLIADIYGKLSRSDDEKQNLYQLTNGKFFCSASVSGRKHGAKQGENQSPVHAHLFPKSSGFSEHVMPPTGGWYLA